MSQARSVSAVFAVETHSITVTTPSDGTITGLGIACPGDCTESYAYGTSVTAGSMARGSVTDLAPTILYYLGIPVGRDMDGYPRTDLFQRSFTLGVPTTYIATHER